MDKSMFRIEYLEEIDSTNTELKRRGRLGAPSGLVLVADGQTAGRGRMERVFLSPRGSGLYESSASSRPPCGGRSHDHPHGGGGGASP